MTDHTMIGTCMDHMTTAAINPIGGDITWRGNTESQDGQNGFLR